jgi:hypothetical protein
MNIMADEDHQTPHIRSKGATVPHTVCKASEAAEIYNERSRMCNDINRTCAMRRTPA